MRELQVFISTYNRPDIICNTIDSILNQKGVEFEVIVSDNSTNNQTYELLKNYRDRIKYIKRNVSVNAVEHWNLILGNVTSKYFIIFHDDDIMLDGMLSAIYEAFSNDDEVIAVGSNANTVKNNKIIDTWFLKNNEDVQIVSNGTQMARRYLGKNQIVPFPSYAYKKRVADELKFDPKKGGKYCDVAFLIDVANLGKVKFIAKPLMDYYVHSSQYSFVNEFNERIRLINYIKKCTSINKFNKELRLYRTKNIYEQIRDSGVNFSTLFRNRSIILIKESDYRSFIKLYVLAFFKRLFPRS